MYDMIDYNPGILNEGDASRILRAMQKAEKGEPVTVAFLGGSITQGSVSSTPETCYAYLVYSWWKERFPKSEVTYVNAGIGGTPSQFGVARVEEEVLGYNPDFMTVEFSVNDSTQSYTEWKTGVQSDGRPSQMVSPVVFFGLRHFNNVPLRSFRKL